MKTKLTILLIALTAFVSFVAVAQTNESAQYDAIFAKGREFERNCAALEAAYRFGPPNPSSMNFNELPSPQRITQNGIVVVEQGRAEWMHSEDFGRSKTAQRNDQKWLYVNILGDIGFPGSCDLPANLTNTVITTSHEPVIIHTNGIYYITFKP